MKSMKTALRYRSKRITVSFILLITLISMFVVNVVADEEKTIVTGQKYEFVKDSHYDLQKPETAAETNDSNTYGSFYLKGDVKGVSRKDGVPAYEVGSGNLDFFYQYDDELLTADEDSWHLIDDKSNKVNGLTLKENIMKGAVILQTSKDRKSWVEAGELCNAFSNVPNRTEPVFATKEAQLINGCYYRITVAYELKMRTEESNILFVNTDKHAYKKCAEVYEFYAYTESGAPDISANEQIYNLGEKTRTENFDGYYGEKLIDKKDDHYGWDLGKFFVSGYTDERADADGNIVFLKNVGDKMTLWFNLEQDINGLNGNNKLKITADKDGYDQYFETDRKDFGRGTLIIRYTDYNNVKQKPIIYTDYLEANATAGADTKVQLLEEGDYEVALDYEVTSDEFIDKIGHYRIFFKFSVRNGNCMVYPFDVKTGDELNNSSMTENGFRLNLAKSRYLKINLKREVMKDSADGLVEDTRFNGPAKDGAEYTDEGIYTITVTNEYTNQFTVKKIYVGSNSIMRAYMATGLSIPEINDLVAHGAVIAEDGTIQLASRTDTTEPSETVSAACTEVSGETSAQNASEPETETAGLPGNQIKIIAIAAVGVVVLILIIAGVISARKKKARRAEAENDG